MAFFLRTLTFPPLNQILAVPQIVVIDQTGPVISFGTKAGAACLVAEFIAGTFVPTEVFSTQDVVGQYSADGTVYRYLSQNGAATPIQDGTAVGFNGNGMLALLKKTFQRLILVRVDHEAVTTDGGTTKATLSVTVTVAAVDQDGASNTNKDIVIPAGARFGDAVFATATRVFATSGNFTIPKGTALTANAVTVQVPCFPVRVVEPVVATAIAAVSVVIDPVLQSVAATTTITAVTNATALWPNGTGTTLATRVESQYPVAINKTLPTNVPVNDVVILWAARRSVAIRQALASNAVASSAIGRGRMVPVSAEPAANATSGAATAAITAAIGLAASDGYTQPADRVIICFPQAKIQVPDFGNIKVTVNSDSWMATTLANFAEEYNPGISLNPYIQTIVELEDAFVANPISYQAHINLIAGGVAALLRGTAGWEWMQGVTAANSVLFPTRTPIKRRRMADLIQDTLAALAAPYQKGPATIDNVDAFVASIQTFLENLKSPDLPAAQRIVDYAIDEKSGNTQPLNALGVYIFKVYVQTLPSLDFPVFITQIGETVVIPTSVPAAA